MSWLERFSGLASLPDEQRQLLLENSNVVALPADTVIFGPGNTPDSLLLLLQGSVRVQQLSEKGREIVLYRVRAGESCVLTTACLLACENYSAQGVAETAVQAVSIPLNVFDDMLGRSKVFRQFVFQAYSNRITELFHVIEEVAFRKVDVRLALKLMELAQGDNIIRITHQQLAAELGTAREVVSRQLSEFQRRHWIAQMRGVVEIKDVAALQRLARD